MAALIDFAGTAEELLEIEPEDLGLILIGLARVASGPQRLNFTLRIRGAFVIARNTAFTYKGKAADVKQIGCELDVRYVLERRRNSLGERNFKPECG
jgi:hypothetical protein